MVPKRVFWVFVLSEAFSFFVVVMTRPLGQVMFSGGLTAVAFNLVYLGWMKEYKHPASLSGGVFSSSDSLSISEMSMLFPS